MSYISHQPASYQFLRPGTAEHPLNRLVYLPTRPHDISLHDKTLDNINTLWTAIMGKETDPHTFLRFEEREQEHEAGV